jgi:hypothetical protein
MGRFFVLSLVLARPITHPLRFSLQCPSLSLVGAPEVLDDDKPLFLTYESGTASWRSCAI